jgi:hypothetical protein
MCATGLMRRVVADVYAPIDCPLTLDVRAAAASLLVADLPRGGVVGHLGAAWLYCGTRATSGPAPARLVVLVPHLHTLPRSGALHLRQSELSEDQVERVGGLRVTSPVRTAADAARLLEPSAAAAVLRALQASSGVRPQAVQDALNRLPARRGRVSARTVVAQWAHDVGEPAPGERRQSSARRPVMR